jgi:hypothetical protein
MMITRFGSLGIDDTMSCMPLSALYSDMMVPAFVFLACNDKCS